MGLNRGSMFNVKKSYMIDRKDVRDFQYESWHVIRLAEEELDTGVDYYVGVVSDPLQDIEISIAESYRYKDLGMALEKFRELQIKYYGGVVKDFSVEEWECM